MKKKMRAYTVAVHMPKATETVWIRGYSARVLAKTVKGILARRYGIPRKDVVIVAVYLGHQEDIF
jgi:hypothetical protein